MGIARANHLLKNLNFIFFVLTLSVAPIVLGAVPTKVSTKLQLTNPKPWLGGAKTLSGYKKHFFELYKAHGDKKYYLCKKNKKFPSGAPERLRVWWSYLQLQCAFKSDFGKKNSRALRATLNNHRIDLTSYAGQSDQLNKSLVKILVQLSGEKYYTLSSSEISFLNQHQGELQGKERAKYYNFLALKHIEKKEWSPAAEMYFQALQISGEPIYATRLKTLVNNKEQLKPQFSEFIQSININMGKKVSFAKFYKYFRRKQYVTAFKLAVEGLNADESIDRKVLSKMFKVLYKKNDGLPLDSRIEKQALSCHSVCLLELGKKYFSKHKYSESRAFAVKSLELNSAPKAMMLAGFSSLQLGDYKSAIQFYKNSMKSAKEKSTEYFESVFRLGLIYYRTKKYKQVVQLFSNLKKYKSINDFHLMSHYWYWRALQSLKSSKANKVRDLLIQQYPLTYYGLKANQEKNKGQLKLPQSLSPIEVDPSWTKQQQVSWLNYKELLSLMMTDLAQKELRVLFDLSHDGQTALYSYFSSLGSHHFSAIRAMNMIWDKDPQTYFSGLTVKLTLPTEFEILINDYAQKNKVEPALIQSLIKQESSFRLRAVSSSNAMGLMQLIPMTAKDSARYLKLSSRNLRSRVFQPELNIRLGTSYYARLQRAFLGNVPFALAAYNAGIGNIRRWMKPRKKELGPLPELSSSLPENEIWIDELPWAETNFYVKAILRNLILYRFYYRQQQVIPEPSWHYKVGQISLQK